MFPADRPDLHPDINPNLIGLVLSPTQLILLFKDIKGLMISGEKKREKGICGGWVSLKERGWDRSLSHDLLQSAVLVSRQRRKEMGHSDKIYF